MDNGRSYYMNIYYSAKISILFFPKNSRKKLYILVFYFYNLEVWDEYIDPLVHLAFFFVEKNTVF